MKKVDAESPAFPRNGQVKVQNGMTIRTWLAGQALVGIAGAGGSAESTADRVVELADAVIEELNRVEEDY